MGGDGSQGRAFEGACKRLSTRDVTRAPDKFLLPQTCASSGELAAKRCTWEPQAKLKTQPAPAALVLPGSRCLSSTRPAPMPGA